MAEVEAIVAPDAIFATNTSTIPISDIAALMRIRERVLGMHFFSPVDEDAAARGDPDAEHRAGAIVTAVQFGRKMGKTVIVVADRPGFWVNRILSPYLNEAGILLTEGVPIELIDRAMTRLRLSGRAGDAARRGRARRRREGRRRHADGVRRPDGAVARRRRGWWRTAGWAGRAGRASTSTRTARRAAVDESAYAVIGVKPVDGHGRRRWCESG